MFWSRKGSVRREKIREDRPDTVVRRWEKLRDDGVFVSVQIAAIFFVLATAILMLRPNVVRYRAGQFTHHDILSRVEFSYTDPGKLADAQQLAREKTAHVY